MNANRVWFGLVCALTACGDDGALERGGALAVDDDRVFSDAAVQAAPSSGAELGVKDLGCVHDGAVGKVAVAFDCYEITTVSCKDLSNVVIEFEDGSRQRFEGLSGQRGVFRGTSDHAGVQITTVWVKAGANHSGDGPGYGERFDAPTITCPPVAPPSDAGVPPDACFVADGICEYIPTPPTPPKTPGDEPIGF